MNTRPPFSAHRKRRDFEETGMYAFAEFEEDSARFKIFWEDESAPAVTGRVAADGSSEWSPAPGAASVSVRSREDLIRLARAQELCWEWASQEIERWEVAGCRDFDRRQELAGAIDELMIREITKIEGGAPSAAEIRNHWEVVKDEAGELYRWKGAPILTVKETRRGFRLIPSRG